MEERTARHVASCIRYHWHSRHVITCACSVAASYKSHMLVTRFRLPAPVFVIFPRQGRGTWGAKLGVYPKNSKSLGKGSSGARRESSPPAQDVWRRACFGYGEPSQNTLPPAHWPMVLEGENTSKKGQSICASMGRGVRVFIAGAPTVSVRLTLFLLRVKSFSPTLLGLGPRFV